MKRKPRKLADNNGTSLRGYVETTYDALCHVFGPPNQVTPETACSDDKVVCGWAFKLKGVTVTIYCYRVSELPVGHYYWHVGGFAKDGAKCVQLVAQALVNKGFWRSTVAHEL